MLGFVNRNTRLFSNVRCLNILYVALVRSIVDYCSVIWSPSYSTHITRIEKLQRRFIKLLCYRSGLQFDSQPYSFFLQYFGLPHLISRRKYYDILFAYKVLNNIINCPQILSLFSISTPSRVLRQQNIFDVEFHRTNYGKFSPLTRICNSVNVSGVDLEAPISFNSLKRRLQSSCFTIWICVLLAISSIFDLLGYIL